MILLLTICKIYILKEKKDTHEPVMFTSTLKSTEIIQSNQW